MKKHVKNLASIYKLFDRSVETSRYRVILLDFSKLDIPVPITNLIFLQHWRVLLP